MLGVAGNFSGNAGGGVLLVTKSVRTHGVKNLGSRHGVLGLTLSKGK